MADALLVEERKLKLLLVSVVRLFAFARYVVRLLDDGRRLCRSDDFDFVVAHGSFSVSFQR